MQTKAACGSRRSLEQEKRDDLCRLPTTQMPPLASHWGTRCRGLRTMVCLVAARGYFWILETAAPLSCRGQKGLAVSISESLDEQRAVLGELRSFSRCHWTPPVDAVPVSSDERWCRVGMSTSTRRPAWCIPSAELLGRVHRHGGAEIYEKPVRESYMSQSLPCTRCSTVYSRVVHGSGSVGSEEIPRAPSPTTPRALRMNTTMAPAIGTEIDNGNGNGFASARCLCPSYKHLRPLLGHEA